MKQFLKNIKFKSSTLLLFVMLCTYKVSAQWITQNSNTTENLTSIQFVTPDIGYVIGENSVFLKTLNGGDSWTQMDTPFTGDDFFNFSSLYFINELVGVIEVDDKGIAKTIDGGNTWELMDIGGDFGSMNIIFIDDQVGILVNDNKIFRTTNFGDTWNEINIGTLSEEFDHSDEIEFLNDEIGWIVTNSVMLKTYDGGLTWEFDFDYRTHPDLVQSAALLHRIEAFSEDTLFVGSRYYIGFFSSVNGGGNFEYTAPMIVWDIEFINSSIGYVIDDANAVKFIKKTTDAGASWTTLYGFPSPNFNDNLYDLYFINESTGWAVGTNGTILKTENGGGTSTSTENVEFNNNMITLFPNPARNKINLQLKEDLNIKTIRLYDNTGKEISIQYNNQQREIILDDLNLPHQLYNLTFLLKNGTLISKKIILNTE